MLARVLPSQNAGPRRRAHRLIAKRRAKKYTAPGHRIQVRRQVHGIDAHGADRVPAELIRNNQNDVGPARVGSRLRQRLGRSSECGGDSGQPGPSRRVKR